MAEGGLTVAGKVLMDLAALSSASTPPVDPTPIKSPTGRPKQKGLTSYLRIKWHRKTLTLFLKTERSTRPPARAAWERSHRRNVLPARPLWKKESHHMITAIPRLRERKKKRRLVAKRVRHLRASSHLTLRSHRITQRLCRTRPVTTWHGIALNA